MIHIKTIKKLLIMTFGIICFTFCSCSHDMSTRPETETVVLDRKDLYGVGNKNNSIDASVMAVIENYVAEYNTYAPEEIQLKAYAVTPMSGGYAITGANGVQGMVQVNSSGSILILTPLDGTSTQKIQISLASIEQMMNRDYFPEDKEALKNAIQKNCDAVSESFKKTKEGLSVSGLDTSLPDVSDQIEADQRALEELIAKCDAFLEKYFPEDAA